MAGKDVDLRCSGTECDPSALRLSMTETGWYRLDVTPEGVYPTDPESDGDPFIQLVCLDCGREVPVTKGLRTRLRFE